MAEFPALPLWTDAYLSDTHPDLTLEEHGAYLLLLIASWRRPDCALPNDDKWLCRFLGVHGNQWRKLRASVLERFFTLTEAGNWQQKRLRKERDFVEKKREKQREKAEKRWSEEREIKALADAEAMPPHPQPTPTPIEEDTKNKTPPPQAEAATETDKPKRKPFAYSEGFERFWQIYPTHVQDTKRDCWFLWKAAINRGESEETILQHAAEYRSVWLGQKFRIGARRYLKNEEWHRPVPVPTTDAPFANAHPPAKSPINIHQRALERLSSLGFDDDDTGSSGGYLALAH